LEAQGDKERNRALILNVGILRNQALERIMGIKIKEA